MLATGLVAAQTARTKYMSANHCCTVLQVRMVARGRSGADNHIAFKKMAHGELVANKLPTVTSPMWSSNSYSRHQNGPVVQQ